MSYLKDFRWQIILIFLSISLISSAILGLGYALKYLIDQGFVTNSLKHLNYAFLFITALIVLLGFASYNRSSKVNWICQEIESNIKRDIFKKIINISPSYFDSHKISDILSTLNNDLTLVSNSIVMTVSFALRNIMMTIGGIILLLCSNLKLTSYVFVILLLIFFPLLIMGKRIRKISQTNQENISNLNGHIEESLSFIKMLQAYNRELFSYQKFLELNNKVNLVAKKRINLRSILFALVISCVLFSVVFVLWVGGNDVLNGSMTAGSLSSFIFYSILVASSLAGLSEVYSDWQRAYGALERIINIANAQPLILEHEITSLTPKEINIKFNNLCFAYPTRPEITVLDNINLTLSDSDKIVAFVGPSGAGKTTIFQLLLRFYDPMSGEITIGDINIKNLSLSDLRENFALVSQDPVIFSGSAYENILYGRIDAKKEDIYNAAQAAEILDFFQSLPEGLDTYLGEKGLKLSGGQKQRISIARAILKNPKILLLDEATSSLDSENEKLVQNALFKLRQGKLTLVIAHRISTIMDADLIVVLDKGKIVATGKHDFLIRNSPLYQRLNLQYNNS